MWIEVFKAGTHTDSNGKSAEYSAQSLDEIAQTYNSRVALKEQDRAPLVKGHPMSNSPAYGWIDRLARRGNELFAKLDKLSPDILSEVRNGAYRRVSIALYPDKMLRHIGLLGAVPPALNELPLVEFEENSDYELFESDNLNQYETDEKPETVDQASIVDQINRLKTENLQLSSEIALLRKESRLKEFRQFADSLIEHPKGALITPSQAQELVDILEMAYSADSAYSEIDSVNTPNVERIKLFFSGMKPAITFSEFARSKSAPIPPDDNFAPARVSPDRLALHQRAKEIQCENPGMSYEESALKAKREG
jgi:hypothetical protein